LRTASLGLRTSRRSALTESARARKQDQPTGDE